MNEAASTRIELCHLMDDLTILEPVQGLIYVGAGNGRAVSEQLDAWDVDNALLVEANPGYRDALQALANPFPDRAAVVALLGESESERDFYLVSNPHENSVIAPAVWQTIWPNLTSTGVVTLKEERLDQLLTQSAYKQIANTANWLIVDCFPPLPILRGARGLIAQCSVVKARCIFDDDLELVPDGHLTELNIELEQFGFRHVANSFSNHPALGEALFVRDWRASFSDKLDSTVRQLAEATQLAADRDATITRLRQERDHRDALLLRHQQELSEVSDALDEQSLLLAEREERIAEITKEKERSEEEAFNLTGQVDQLRNNQDEQSRFVAECKTEIDKLQKENSQRSESFSAQKSALESKVEQHQSRIAHLEKNATDRQVEITELRQTASLSTKLLAVREADLHDLQERYAEAQSVQEKQHQLLVRLGERLRVASRYFHQLRDCRDNSFPGAESALASEDHANNIETP